MRIISKQVENQPLTVIVEYPEYDRNVSGLIQKIENLDIQFVGYDEEKQTKIGLFDIYYIENVERKLFIYTKQSVYRYDSSMAKVEEMAKNTNLVRISRTCFMNIEHLKEMRQVKNSHLEAVLDNNEMLIVSRKYLKDIKNVFRG